MFVNVSVPIIVQRLTRLPRDPNGCLLNPLHSRRHQPKRHLALQRRFISSEPSNSECGGTRFVKSRRMDNLKD